MPIAVVREHRIARLSSSSRVVSYMCCVMGTVWGSELVCLCEINLRQCVVCTVYLCLCCVVLCCVVLCCVVSLLSATEWLVVSSAVDMLFSNTHF